MTIQEIHIDFFRFFTGQRNTYKVLWMDWLGGYADKILDDNFCDNYKCPYRDISDKQVREIWEFGTSLLRTKSESKKKIYEKEKHEYKLIVEKVISYLNEKAGTTFESSGEKNAELILARYKEGHTISDFHVVIDRKTKQWLGTEQQKYLRPLTLFSKTKFENYLNETDNIKKDGKQSVTTGLQRIKSVAEEAKNFNFSVGKNTGRS
jgi:uncharacterized phage protein (TIGR02220 family)